MPTGDCNFLVDLRPYSIDTAIARENLSCNEFAPASKSSNDQLIRSDLMIQGQYDPPTGKQCFLTPRRDPLLQRHPVLVPVMLLCGSVVLYLASFFADALFPVFTFFGIPAGSICLLFALVTGISGILTSIIGLIERVDRSSLHTHVFPNQRREHSL